MPANLADRLAERIKHTKAPIVVGLDPRLKQIPLVYREGCEQTFAGAAEAIVRFNQAVIDASCELAPAVKPQAAFYEQYGFEGVKALQQTIAYAQSKGMLVIVDGKRNDIGSTARAYAEAYLGSVDVLGTTVASPYGADFLTVSGYEGIEGLVPFFEVARDNSKGVFVLVKTSNPGSLFLQSAVCEGGSTVALSLAEQIETRAVETAGECGYSPIGAVVGATYPKEAAVLRQAMPHSWFLVPGYGAQGAGGGDIVPAFGQTGYGAVVNSSRGILYAYEKAADEHISDARYRLSVKQAIESMRDDIYQALVESYPDMAY